MNILVTGTPGVGKTSLCGKLADKLGMKHVELSLCVKQFGLYDQYLEEFDTLELNEDKVVDWLDTLDNNFILDTHSVGYLPFRMFSLVVCLTSTKVYDRLKCRGYSDRKLQENVQCEIFQICAEEAMEFENCHVLPNDTLADMDQNVDFICKEFEKLVYSKQSTSPSDMP
jgi:broad-specificity NMP kinase